MVLVVQVCCARRCNLQSPVSKVIPTEPCITATCKMTLVACHCFWMWVVFFLLVVVDWCSVFSNEFCNLPNFFAKSQQSCVHILFNFQVPLYTSYILLHFGLQQQLFRPRNFWNPFKEYLCCLLWADLSYVSLCFRLEKIKCKPELRLSAQFISSDTKLW